MRLLNAENVTTVRYGIFPKGPSFEWAVEAAYIERCQLKSHEE